MKGTDINEDIEVLQLNKRELSICDYIEPESLKRDFEIIDFLD